MSGVEGVTPERRLRAIVQVSNDGSLAWGVGCTGGQEKVSEVNPLDAGLTEKDSGLNKI